ncbi:MAG: hypothetical protein J6S98_09620 [Lentisphaeria bacterium]|nr:hypothetical protein [Lentisphaeria bacterium]
MRDMVANDPKQFKQRGGVLYQAELADPEIRNAIPKYTGEQAKEVLKSLAGKPLKNLESGIVAQINSNQRGKLFSSDAINKSVDNGYSWQDHLTAVANIESLFENAVPLKKHDNRKSDDGSVMIYRFAAPIAVSEGVADALLLVKETLTTDKKTLYTLELTEIKRPSGQAVAGKSDYGPEGIDNIRRKHDKVKPFIEKNPGNLFQDGTVVRGATSFGDYFDQNYRAIITLFEGTANASTLVQ